MPSLTPVACRRPAAAATGNLPMEVAVLGAGAIGGLLGVHLSAAGTPVTLIDRPDRLRDLRRGGLSVLRPDGSQVSPRAIAMADAAEITQAFDMVILAVKAHEIAAALPALARLTGADTTIVPVQNGIPWWYFHGTSGPFAGQRLHAADPDGRIGECIDTGKIVACVAYPAADLQAPNLIRHVEGNRFTVGELDGQRSERVERISGLLVDAGFKAPVAADIRAEIWLKAWGNLAFNPVSALTRASMAAICRLPETRSLVARMMQEAAEIAAKLGISFRVSLERRLDGAEQVGEHKTSMLQDLEAGRPLELEALVGTVLEIAQLVDVRVPTIEAVYALTRLLDLNNRA